MENNLILRRNDWRGYAQEEYDKLAKEYVYGLDFGYDTVLRAGKRDGFRYYRFLRKADKGHKVGFAILKISPSGTVEEVEDFSEIMWAVHQGNLLNQTLQ